MANYRAYLILVQVRQGSIGAKDVSALKALGQRACPLIAAPGVVGIAFASTETAQQLVAKARTVFPAGRITVLELGQDMHQVGSPVQNDWFVQIAWLAQGKEG